MLITHVLSLATLSGCANDRAGTQQGGEHVVSTRQFGHQLRRYGGTWIKLHAPKIRSVSPRWKRRTPTATVSQRGELEIGRSFHNRWELAAARPYHRSTARHEASISEGKSRRTTSARDRCAPPAPRQCVTIPGLTLLSPAKPHDSTHGTRCIGCRDWIRHDSRRACEGWRTIITVCSAATRCGDTPAGFFCLRVRPRGTTRILTCVSPAFIVWLLTNHSHIALRKDAPPISYYRMEPGLSICGLV